MTSQRHNAAVKELSAMACLVGGIELTGRQRLVMKRKIQELKSLLGLNKVKR